MDKMENKICQNCKKNFTIEPDDFSFYEKMNVPPPTFCPTCRAQRRMLWRNENKLFKKKDDKIGKEIFSQYHPDSPIKIYENDYWMSDNWDPMKYGRNYDFSQSFFTQFKDLLYSVPAKARILTNNINSEYCNNADDLKNCYLCFNAIMLEDCLYTLQSLRMRDCCDVMTSSSSENCYDSINVTDSNNLQSCVDCADSVSLLYCIDCRNCQNCIGCVGLRNKNNYIFNIQYTKEEYNKKVVELNIASHNARQKIKEKMLELYKLHPFKYMHTMKSVNSFGEYIYGSKNTKNAWLTMKTENVKYVQDTRYTKDAYDTLIAWKSEQVYESACCGLDSSIMKFVFQCHPGNIDLTYCAFCSNSSHLFGCVGLRNKEYCVFNKQYSKEEYQGLVDKIIEQMKNLEYKSIDNKSYKYGEFFPPEFSPLAYNETIAQDFFPINETKAKNVSFNWRSHDNRKYIPTILTNQIPDSIKETEGSITEEIIECADKEDCSHDCTKAFRITAREFDFYKKLNIPPPKKCPNCRYGDRLLSRGGMEYWHRTCMCDNERHFHGKTKCNVEFETFYAPNRSEIVYCEKCYQQEVY